MKYIYKKKENIKTQYSLQFHGITLKILTGNNERKLQGWNNLIRPQGRRKVRKSVRGIDSRPQVLLAFVKPPLYHTYFGKYRGTGEVH